MTPPSYEQVAQLADLRVAIVPDPGTWGVWDRHTQGWVSHGHDDERDAWKALIQTVSDHPWELRIAQADDAGRPVLPQEQGTRCTECAGTGECSHCGTAEACPDCGGEGSWSD